MHKYTLHPDDPDFVRAKVNAQQISDVRQLLKILKIVGGKIENLENFMTFQSLKFLTHADSVQVVG